MTDKEYLKDIIAGETYTLLLRAEAKLPLSKKYLIVEFGEDGKIDRISVNDSEERGARTISVDVEGIDNGRDLVTRIRDRLDDVELDMDMRYWELVGNAYDWAWSGADEE